MSSDLDNLLARRTAILAELATLASRVSYKIDGQEVDHNAYRKSLLAELKTLNELIDAAQGPFEVETKGQ
jgi:hypothetical protein